MDEKREIRKRRKAPKARTGCQLCKSRHVRCDESKPTCGLCQRTNTQCIYNPIRQWSVQSTKPKMNPRHAPQPDGLTIDELKSLQLWNTCTGPWMTNYTPWSCRKFWLQTLPRCAVAMPALRHIMTAVVLLDECIPGMSMSSMKSRYLQLLEHYCKAIGTMARPVRASKLEMALCSMMAWMLEVMASHSPTAQYHLSALTRLVEASRQEEHPEVEAKDILLNELPETANFCQGYSWMPGTNFAEVPTTEHPILAGLILRRGSCPVDDVEKIISAWQHYFTSLQPLVPGGMVVDEAKRYIFHWNIVVLRYRFVGSVDWSVLLLAYLAGKLATALLPPVVDDTMTRSGVGFVLERALDLSSRPLSSLDEYHRDRLVSAMTTTVIDHCPVEELRDMASAVLRSLPPDSCSCGSEVRWTTDFGSDASHLLEYTGGMSSFSPQVRGRWVAA